MISLQCSPSLDVYVIPGYASRIWYKTFTIKCFSLILMRDHLFSTYAKFSKKAYPLIRKRTCVYQGGMLVFRKICVRYPLLWLFFFIGQTFTLKLLTPDLSLPSLNVSWTQNVGRNCTVSYQRQGDPTVNQISTTNSSILISSLGKPKCCIFVVEVYLALVKYLWWSFSA